MSVQTGLAPPNTGRTKPVYADIRTTPYGASLHVYMIGNFFCIDSDQGMEPL